MNDEQSTTKNRSLLINLGSIDTKMLLESDKSYKIPLVLNLNVEDKDFSFTESVNLNEMAYAIKKYENFTIFANIVRQEVDDILSKEKFDNEFNFTRESEMERIKNANKQQSDQIGKTKSKWYKQGGCMQSCNSPDFDYYEQKKVNLTDIEINIDGKYETVPEQLLITLKLNTEIN